MSIPWLSSSLARSNCCTSKGFSGAFVEEAWVEEEGGWMITDSPLGVVEGVSADLGE